MGSGLSIGGLSSNLDTAAIIKQLLAVESQPIATMKAKQTKLNNQSNLLSSIKLQMMTLQSAASDLTMSATFGGRKISSSDSTNKVATAVAQNGAVNTTYAVHVGKTATTTTYVSSRLGSAQAESKTFVTSGKRLTDTGLATGIAYDLTAAVGVGHAGDFTINGTTTITVNAADSINDIITNINASGAGVTASIDSNNKIVLTNNTGGAKPLTVTAGSGNILSYLKLDAANLQTQYGQNAAAATGWSSGTAAVTTGTALADVSVAALNTQFGAGSPALGNFTINGAKITVTDTDTINTVMNKITSSAAGVTASLVGDQVVLTQKNVGSSSKIVITSTGTSLDSLGLTSGTTVGTDADESKLIKDVDLFSGMGSGYFSINGTFIYVDKDKDTMNSVIAKINQSSAGVLANFNSDTDQITLTSKTPGDSAITFGNSTTDSIDFIHRVDLTGSQGTTTGKIDPIKGGRVTGHEAEVTINGTAVVTKDSTATLNGVTFTFLGEGDTVLTVSNDTDKTVAKVQAFIDAYNALNASISSAISQKPDQTGTDATQGILFGDSMLTTISYNLRSMVSQTVAGGDSKYTQLSQVGITTGAAGSSVDAAKSGNLVLDSTKFLKALTDNPDAVYNLFGKSNRVFAEKTTMDGTQTQVTLATHPLSQAFVPQVTVNGVTYSAVKDAASFSTTPATAQKQFWVDYKTGTINFYSAPTASAVVSVNYDYDTTNSGLALRFKNLLSGYAKFGGSFDSRIGSNGSIPNQVKDLTDRINKTEDRVAKHQETLQRQFTAMERMLNSLKSQQSSFNSLLGTLSSSKNS